MTQSILAKSLAGLEDRGAKLHDRIEAAFGELHAAIAAGDRKAQETFALELHALVNASSGLVTAAHDHAKSLLPAATVDKGEAQSAEDAAAKGRKR